MPMFPNLTPEDVFLRAVAGDIALQSAIACLVDRAPCLP